MSIKKKTDKAIMNRLKILAQFIRVVPGYFDVVFQKNADLAVIIIEESPAGFFEQLIDFFRACASFIGPLKYDMNLV